LETTVRYSKNIFMPHMVFKQGQQAKSIPDMLCVKVKAEPILHVVVRLGETSVI